MKQPHQNLIVINGQTYDARSGLPVNTTNHAPGNKTFSDIAPHKAKTLSDISGPQRAPRHHVTAAKIHRTPQKTNTLLRSGLRRPHADITSQRVAATPTPKPVQPTQTRTERAASIQRPAAVSHFASHDISPKQPAPSAKKEAAEPAASLSLAQLQSQHPAMKPQAAPQRAETGSQLKETLIKERLAEAPTDPDDRFEASQHKVNNFFSKQPRLLTAAAGALSVLLLVGYVTYLNLPSISMRVAANRAGFSATMPGYKPSGYALNGPVSYSPGQVSLNFNSNTNADKFTLTQKESSWDSQALLDNYVAKQTGNYLTYQEKGLTIYMYDGKASWVNGGVWYNINGSADLSSDQILKMATSM